jgi:hypothetical protein
MTNSLLWLIRIAVNFAFLADEFNSMNTRSWKLSESGELAVELKALAGRNVRRIGRPGEISYAAHGLALVLHCSIP